MLETINNLILVVADPLLNWLLIFPRDVVIFIVALATSAAITFSRKWSTDQDWLRRADQDAKRLKELTKEAKKNKDKEAVQRHKMTMGLIKMRSLKYEGKPLLIALLPILILATWCFGRMGFHPPSEGDEVAIKMYVPRAGIDSVAYMMPVDGVSAVDGWVQRVKEDTYPEPEGLWDTMVGKCADFLQLHPPLGGVAVWHVKALSAKEPYLLKLVYDGEVYEKDFLVGRKIYSTQLVFLGLDKPVQAIEQVLRPFKLFGIVGGFGAFFPPWLVAYLMITLIFVPLLKKVCKIY